jgi:hypothetical protein
MMSKDEAIIQSLGVPTDPTNRNFLTPGQCAQQFEMYAQTNPSKDSQHSLRFCAKFIREFCIQQNNEPKTPITESELSILRRRCKTYHDALEIIAGNEADVNREKADGIAIAALAGSDGAY